MNSILQTVIILRYHFSDGAQNITSSLIHWFHSPDYRRWRLAVQTLSYTQLSWISQQNQNCFHPHAHLIQALQRGIAKKTTT